MTAPEVEAEPEPITDGQQLLHSHSSSFVLSHKLDFLHMGGFPGPPAEHSPMTPSLSLSGAVHAVVFTDLNSSFCYICTFTGSVTEGADVQFCSRTFRWNCEHAALINYASAAA